MRWVQLNPNTSDSSLYLRDYRPKVLIMGDSILVLSQTGSAVRLSLIIEGASTSQPSSNSQLLERKRCLVIARRPEQEQI
jgi:hypothetical protein